MSDLIDLIWCKFIILINFLPMYKILLISYLLIPVIWISRYYFKNNYSKPLFLSFILLGVWMIQIIIWVQIHDLYYQI